MKTYQTVKEEIFCDLSFSFKSLFLLILLVMFVSNQLFFPARVVKKKGKYGFKQRIGLGKLKTSLKKKYIIV